MLENLSTTDASQRDLTADIWREEGPWLVLLILPFAALLFRRGILAAVVLAFMLPVSPADAADLGRLWQTPDQQAAEALAQRNPAKAAELFRDPAWKGAASYRAGDYEGTLEALAKLDTTDAAYNRGNALARLGRLEEAIAAYDDVLERNPQHTDAQFNRQLLLEQMQNDSQQSESGEQENQENGEGEQQESGQNSEDRQSADEQDGESGQDQQQSEDSQSADSTTEPEEETEPDELTEEQKKALAQETAEDGDEETDQANQAELMASDELPDEEQQAIEQWLRRIPDDPGGLLRRKFLYQYQRQKQPPAEEEQW